LLHSLKLLPHGEHLGKLHLCSQGEVLSHCQLLVVRSGQLKDIAGVGHVPVTDFFNRDAIDVDFTLCVGAREREREGGRKTGRERGRERQGERERERERERE
jgi:hypothetical protein